MPRDTDASYKLLFSALEVVRDLVLVASSTKAITI